MNPVYIADIDLEQFNGEPSNLYTLVFSDQPDVKDIIDAFDKDRLIQKLPYYERDREKLIDALNCFGVPNLDASNVLDKLRNRVGIPRITNVWIANTIPNGNHSNINTRIGSISIHIKTVTDNAPKREEPKAQVERKKRKTINRKPMP